MKGRGRPRGIDGRVPLVRPIRTREHIIADLSVLHFQWFTVKAGYITATPENDYGYDLILFTFSESGHFENGFIFVQLKATDNLERLLINKGKTISLPIEKRHLQLWQSEPVPIILIVYDAQNEKAYWLHAQKYVQEKRISFLTEQTEVSLHIPLTNILDEAAIR
jgi:hypothetical protein